MNQEKKYVLLLQYRDTAQPLNPSSLISFIQSQNNGSDNVVLVSNQQVAVP